MSEGNNENSAADNANADSVGTGGMGSSSQAGTESGGYGGFGAVTAADMLGTGYAAAPSHGGMVGLAGQAVEMGFLSETMSAVFGFANEVAYGVGLALGISGNPANTIGIDQSQIEAAAALAQAAALTAQQAPEMLGFYAMSVEEVATTPDGVASSGNDSGGGGGYWAGSPWGVITRDDGYQYVEIQNSNGGGEGSA